VPVFKAKNVVDFDVADASCARLEDGSVQCWGADNSGQLGRDPSAPAPSNEPAPVAGLARAKGVSTASRNACAITADGSVACWGAVDGYPWTPKGCRFMTQNGAAEEAAEWPFCPKPTRLPVVKNVVAIDMGGKFSCALESDGSIWCWGDGSPPGRVTI
jgi:alpha-tubulin suppressor-like RCC1 family protein